MSAAQAGSPGTAAQREWIARVLGVALPDAPPVTAAASVRPDAAPTTELTTDLLASIARAIPDDPAALPSALAAFMPRFVQAAISEPAMDTPVLKAGEALGAQDRMLDLVVALKAVKRSARKREALAARAAAETAALDALEKSERDPAAQEAYEARLLQRDETRDAALSEEKRYQSLLDDLTSAARGLAAA